MKLIKVFGTRANSTTLASCGTQTASIKNTRSPMSEGSEKCRSITGAIAVVNFSHSCIHKPLLGATELNQRRKAKRRGSGMVYEIMRAGDVRRRYLLEAPGFISFWIGVGVLVGCMMFGKNTSEQLVHYSGMKAKVW